MRQFVRLTFACFTVLFFSGCAATPVRGSSTRVRLTNQEPGEHCEYLGDVVGNQGDAFSGSFTSNENLEIGARNDMKNKAADLGANVVHVLANRAGQTGSTSYEFGSSEQTNVTYMGAAYFCPRKTKRKKSAAE